MNPHRQRWFLCDGLFALPLSPSVFLCVLCLTCISKVCSVSLGVEIFMKFSCSVHLLVFLKGFACENAVNNPVPHVSQTCASCTAHSVCHVVSHLMTFLWPVPFCPRFYLGGPTSVRGFSMHSIGPQSEGLSLPVVVPRLEGLTSHLGNHVPVISFWQ